MKCFKSFANAAITLAGLELAHRIRKHQSSLGRGYRFGRNRMREWASRWRERWKLTGVILRSNPVLHRSGLF